MSDRYACRYYSVKAVQYLGAPPGHPEDPPWYRAAVRSATGLNKGDWFVWTGTVAVVVSQAAFEALFDREG